MKRHLSVRKHQLRKQKPGYETLERLKRWPGLARKFTLPVFIYSREHRCYWRPEGNGYVPTKDGAGTWEIDEAVRLTCHCGPEKLIGFESLF
jgi:hypothetical protein